VTDTIFALSSGQLPSGVAVVRLSGPQVRFALETMAGSLPVPRQAVLRDIRSTDGDLIDRGLVLFFAGPTSFTGEDVAEFQVHGGRAVVVALLDALGRLPGCRIAEAGEFTRRAFEGGRLDLTEAEGLADLIAAETDSQRRQALRLAGGAFRARAEAWREQLIALRATIEAELDFNDEGDVPDDVAAGLGPRVTALRNELSAELAAGRRGERIRDGFEVVVLGPPNAGKSSLVNALSARDVAIVTDIPGTTRDLLEVHLDLGGYAVTLIDTAGLRDGGDAIEAEGMRRGRARAAAADLILWLDEDGRSAPDDVVALGVPLWSFRTKADLRPGEPAGERDLAIGDRSSLERLIQCLTREAAGRLGGDTALISRVRQRRCVEEAVEALDMAIVPGLPGEVVADRLRSAGDAVSRLTGRIDIEDVLGSIFSSFCIGK